MMHRTKQTTTATKGRHSLGTDSLGTGYKHNRVRSLSNPTGFSEDAAAIAYTPSLDDDAFERMLSPISLHGRGLPAVQALLALGQIHYSLQTHRPRMLFSVYCSTYTICQHDVELPHVHRQQI